VLSCNRNDDAESARLLLAVLRHDGIGTGRRPTASRFPAFWRPDRPIGDVQSAMARPELAHYVAGWPRPGDLGVVAEDGPPVGAAWLRLLSEQDPGYGFVDAETPELGVGVVPMHRGRGIGSLLLETLMKAAREQRYPR